MLNDTLKALAVDYVAGAMTAEQRDSFEVVLEYHRELRELVARLGEVSAAATLAEPALATGPSAGLRERLLRSLETVKVDREPDCLVVTDPAGQVEWVNEAFTLMCGYTLAELKGRKPGQVLQGPATDAAAVERIRQAIRARVPCREKLVNYHKDGSPYLADIRIAPVLDDAGEPLWLVARERRLPDSVPVAPR
jgi:PAS domain S-box-containing protein